MRAAARRELRQAKDAPNPRGVQQPRVAVEVVGDQRLVRSHHRHDRHLVDGLERRQRQRATATAGEAGDADRSGHERAQHRERGEVVVGDHAGVRGPHRPGTFRHEVLVELGELVVPIDSRHPSTVEQLREIGELPGWLAEIEPSRAPRERVGREYGHAARRHVVREGDAVLERRLVRRGLGHSEQTLAADRLDAGVAVQRQDAGKVPWIRVNRMDQPRVQVGPEPDGPRELTRAQTVGLGNLHDPGRRYGERLWHP